MNSFNYTKFLNSIGFTEVTLEQLNKKYLHKNIKYDNNIMYVKYIYPNQYYKQDPYNWIFLGRDHQDKFIRIELPNEVFMENIDIEILNP